MKKILLAGVLVAFPLLSLSALLLAPHSQFIPHAFACTVSASPTTVPANTNTTINFSFTNDPYIFPYGINQFIAVPDNAMLSNAQTTASGWGTANNDIGWIGGTNAIPLGGTQTGDSVTINATSDTNIIWNTSYNETGFNDDCNTLISVTNPTTPNITFPAATIHEGDTYSTTGSFTDPISSATSWTATVDYGDGAGAQPLTLNPDKTFSLSHLYQDNGQGSLFENDGTDIAVTDGKYTLTVTVTNDQGKTAIRREIVTVNNVIPTVDQITVSPNPVLANNTMTATANFTDAGSLDKHFASWDWGDDNTDTGTVTEPNGSTPGSVTNTHTYTLPGVYTVTLNFTDGNNNQRTGGTAASQTDYFQEISTYPIINQTLTAAVVRTYQVTVTSNHPPTVGTITVSPNPVQINSATSATATFTDADTTDTHTASWNWGDGNTTTGTVTESNGSGSVSDSHTYTTAGVYPVTLTVTDNNGGQGTQTFQYVSAYNPTSQGLFSAGQKYTSPAGAYAANTSLTGTVKFGLSYKYQGTIPTGSRQFSMDFNTANLHFNATTVSSLVIANGMGTLTGTGTINNGTTTYNFLVTGSESANTIRIQITDSSNNVIYDTQPSAAATATPTTSVTGNVLAH